jgi:hypothetical protein
MHLGRMPRNKIEAGHNIISLSTEMEAGPTGFPDCDSRIEPTERISHASACERLRKIRRTIPLPPAAGNRITRSGRASLCSIPSDPSSIRDSSEDRSTSAPGGEPISAGIIPYPRKPMRSAFTEHRTGSPELVKVVHKAFSYKVFLFYSSCAFQGKLNEILVIGPVASGPEEEG